MVHYSRASCHDDRNENPHHRRLRNIRRSPRRTAEKRAAADVVCRRPIRREGNQFHHDTHWRQGTFSERTIRPRWRPCCGATAAGRARVVRGRNPFARLAAAVVGFPKGASDTPVRLEFKVSGDGEIWRRNFGCEYFESHQSAGRRRSDRLMCERFGPFRFATALVVEGERLLLDLRRWSVFGIPLPMWLCPRSQSYESAEDGRFNFHVKISHPLMGSSSVSMGGSIRRFELLWSARSGLPSHCREPAKLVGEVGLEPTKA